MKNEMQQLRTEIDKHCRRLGGDPVPLRLNETLNASVVHEVEGYFQLLLPKEIVDSYGVYVRPNDFYGGECIYAACPIMGGLLGSGLELLPLEMWIETWENGQYAARNENEFPANCKLIVGSYIPRKWDKTIIEIGLFGGGGNLYLDFAPPKGGTVGQVLLHDIVEGEIEVIAPSFKAFLERIVQTMSKLKPGDI